MCGERLGRFAFSAILVSSVCLGVFFTSTMTFAQQRAFVIEAGRETEVEALFSPFNLSDEISGGWRLASIGIDRTVIVISIEGPDRSACEVTLRHPSDPRATRRRTASFSVGVDCGADDEAGRPAVELVIQRLEENDGGRFWGATVADGDREDRAILRSCPWFLDGILLSVLLLCIIAATTFRQLHAGFDRPRETAALFVIATVGALARFTFSQQMLLGAWPYSRTTTLQWLIFYGPGIDTITKLFGSSVYETEVMTTTGLIFALVTPFVVFAHGSLLLGSPRRALIAASLVAVLPIHIRFSFSEVAFIPSIVLSSTLFVVVHMALKDPDRRWRAFAMLVAGPLTAWVITARPLNFLFVGLVVVATLWLCPGVSWRRRAVILVLIGVIGVTMAGFLLLIEHSTHVAEGLNFDVLLNGMRLLVDLERNALVNPSITPIWLTIVAGWAVVRLWKKERAMILFLLGWLLLFFFTHAYVVPESVSMQARYHLHLVVPSVFLVAIGLDTLLDQRRNIGLGLIALTGAAPVLHSGFITDTAYSDFQEVEFVRTLRESIPEGCTVLELVDGGSDQDARFRRFGVAISGGRQVMRYRSINIASEVDGHEPQVDVLGLLSSPPSCLYFYEGLHCRRVSDSRRDVHPSCRAIHELAPLERLEFQHFDNRVYDNNIAPDLRDFTGVVTVSLYRVLDRATAVRARSRTTSARASP